MESREILLQRLNETVAQLLGVYENLSDPGAMVYELWSAKDVLAHLTFWHESFARIVDDLVNDRKPTPLKGRFIDLNQGGVNAMKPLTLAQVLERFDTAHVIIRGNILNPALARIPYKKGSRDYTPMEHLDIVNDHIQMHLRDVNRALAQEYS
jgi:hypothetical protein